MGTDLGKVRLAYAVYGDPWDPRTQSGVARNLGDALERRRPELAVARINTAPSRPSFWLRAALSFRRGRDRWQWSAHLGPRSTRARTASLLQQLERMDTQAELVLQLRTTYLPIGLPYAPYTDNTAQLAREHWPRAAPWGGRQLSKVLAYERAFYSEAAHVFATGQLVADSLVARYGVPRERVTVVGAGSNYVPAATVETAREPWVLFVGYEFQRKGGDRLVRAFREVHRQNPGAQLKIVGPELRLDEPGVEVLGPVRDRQRLAQLYAKSRVFALPVRYEPYGMAFLEAMAHGLPCVGTREGAVAEIIDHGRTGYVVDADDERELTEALTSLIRDSEQAAELGKAGRQRVRDELNWDSVAGRMVDVVTPLVRR